MTIFDAMPFGKYRGTLIGTVIEDDPAYMRWALDNTDLTLDDHARLYLEEQTS